MEVIPGLPLVWLFGSSIIKHAFPSARRHPGRSSLGLQAYLWWQGYSGMSLMRSQRKLTTLLEVEYPPNFILVHIGGNDLDRTPVKALKDRLHDLLKFISQAMPNARIIWSEILPRDWDGRKGLSSARKRLNTFAARTVKQLGGFYLRHVNLTFNRTNYSADGIHLSEIGNELFIDNIRVGLYYFLQGNQPWFTGAE